MGRFLTADWSAIPAPVPYAEFGDPQSLNMYGYARNNPLGIVDTDGHELKVAAELKDTVATMRQQSRSFNAELAAHEGPKAPDLTIQMGSTPNDPSGAPTDGATNAPLTLSMETVSSPMEDPNHYDGYHASTITINTSISKDQGKVEDTLGHEVGHVHDARTKTDEYGHELQHTKATQGKTAWAKRPEEHSAIEFNAKVKKERKQFKQEQRLEDKKHKKT